MNEKLLKLKTRARAYLSAFSLFVLSNSAFALDHVTINDASTLKWQLYQSKVWFRNLDIHDSTFLGCCYNYWIDLTTDEGKAMWSAVLSAMHAADSIVVGVQSKTSSNQVVSVSKW